MIVNDIAVVFPGQGTQRHGMGKDFFDRFEEARATFDEASDALGWDVATMCFGDDPRLHLTEFAQPCILTTEIAMFRSLANAYDFRPAFFGGHSLGEYSALTAAGVIPLHDAVIIVHNRGKLMQRACPKGTCGMAAVIAENLKRSELQVLMDDLDVDMANINSKNQIVVSGDYKDLQSLEQRLNESYGQTDFRFVYLDVSAAFHSRFMTEICDSFRESLCLYSSEFDFSKADRVTSNVSGEFHVGWKTKVLNNLIQQLDSPVLWRDNMDSLATRCHTMVELGPSRPLTAFFKTQNIDCTPLISVKKADAFFRLQ